MSEKFMASDARDLMTQHISGHPEYLKIIEKIKNKAHDKAISINWGVAHFTPKLLNETISELEDSGFNTTLLSNNEILKISW